MVDTPTISLLMLSLAIAGCQAASSKAGAMQGAIPACVILCRADQIIIEDASTDVARNVEPPPAGG